MLKELCIHNIAIIKDECVCPGDALTVLTGETGAGKSIIIDSVGLIIGARASKELIRGGESKAMVSALFENISEEAAAFAEDLGIDVTVEGDGVCAYFLKFLLQCVLVKGSFCGKIEEKGGDRYENIESWLLQP